MGTKEVCIFAQSALSNNIDCSDVIAGRCKEPLSSGLRDNAVLLDRVVLISVNNASVSNAMKVVMVIYLIKGIFKIVDFLFSISSRAAITRDTETIDEPIRYE